MGLYSVILWGSFFAINAFFRTILKKKVSYDTCIHMNMMPVSHTTKYVNLQIVNKHKDNQQGALIFSTVNWLFE